MPTHGYLLSHTFPVYRSLSAEVLLSTELYFLFLTMPDLSWGSCWAGDECLKHRLLQVSNGPRQKGVQRQAQPLDQSVLDLHWCTGLTWLARRTMFFKRYCSSEPYGHSFFSLQGPTAHCQRQEAGQRWVNSPCLRANPKSSPSISEPNYGNANISVNVTGYRIKS